MLLKAIELITPNSNKFRTEGHFIVSKVDNSEGVREKRETNTAAELAI